MNILRYILLFNVLFYASCSLANININKDRYARFLSLTTNDGLCGNYILDILQDNKGFIWIATRTGLTRYDGYHFVNFKHSPDDSLSISNNYIQCLAVDHEGILWAGTKNGLNKYDDKTGTFRIWENINKEKPGLSNPYIRKILPDTNAVLWVETVDGILNKINTETGDVLYYPHQQVTQEYYSYHCLFKDSDGDIWVGNRGKGPYRFHPESGNMHLIKSDPARKEKKRDQEVAFVIEDSKYRFWVGSIDGFWRFYKDTETFERVIPMSSFHCIEDRDGILWLSGGNGVYRFNADNNSAVLYSNNESDPHSLVNNSINVLFEDRDGNIWIGTKDGISVFSKPDNEIQYIRRLTDSDNTLVSNNISSVLEDKQGNIWLGTQKKGLSKWNPKTDTFNNFQHKKGDYSSLASNKVSCLYQDKKHNIWIGLWQGVGFNKYDNKTNTFKKYSYEPNSYKKDWYSAFLEDREGRFMAGFWGASGIHLFNRKDGKFLPYNFHEHTTPMDFPLTDITLDHNSLWTAYNNIIYQYHINIDSFSVFRGKNNGITDKTKSANFEYFKNFHRTKKIDNNIYFATTNGLLSFDRITKEFEQIISNIEITALTKNSGEGILWLGTNKGLGILTNENKFKLIQDNSNKKNPLFGKKIINIKDTNRKLYVATNLGLLIYDLQTAKFLKQQNNTEVYLANNKINSITPYKQGIIVGTDNNLIKINYTNNRIELDTLLQGLMINDVLPEACNNDLTLGTNKGIYLFNNGISKPIKNTSLFNIFNLTKDTAGRIWAGTNKGLLSISADCNQIKLHDQPGKYCLTSHLISFLANDSTGNIWAGTTNNGLNKINSKTLEVDHFYNTIQNTGKYSETKTNIFLQQKNGTIWVGGEKLHRYNPPTNKFEPVPAESFPYNEILGMQEDANENLWVGTADGLVFYNTKTNRSQLFSYLHGLPGFDFSGGSVKLSSNKLLFAGKKGAIIFNPESLSNYSISNKILITGIKVFGSRIFFNTNSPIRLKYNQNFFTLEFSTMQFSGQKEEYQYMLEGVDPDWVETKENSAGYTNIQPGNYAFKIKSNNSNQEESTFSLVIQPPFWKTWWFILLAIMVVTGFIFYWVITITRKQKTEEQRIILEHKLLQLQMNPHFIFNVLIAIQSFIYRNDTYESGLYLSKFAKLMRIFLQNSRNEWITLSKEIESLQYYLNLQQLRVENKFEYTVDCVNIPDPDYVHIPPMIIQPFVENSIEHGFANLSYPGIIQISFETKATCLEAIIRDNGKGYYPKKDKHKKKSHESIATEIIKKRIKTLNNLNCKTGLTIRNRSNENTSGTEVIIRFPYKKEF